MVQPAKRKVSVKMTRSALGADAKKWLSLSRGCKLNLCIEAEYGEAFMHPHLKEGCDSDLFLPYSNESWFSLAVRVEGEFG